MRTVLSLRLHIAQLHHMLLFTSGSFHLLRGERRSAGVASAPVLPVGRSRNRQWGGHWGGVGHSLQFEIGNHQSGQKISHLWRLGWVKARRERYWPGTRGWARPARVVRNCPLLPVHIHTLHTPPLILLLAKAIILLKKDLLRY